MLWQPYFFATTIGNMLFPMLIALCAKLFATC